MPDQEFSIQDLCDQTGLPRRTIHFYIQQEILPPPADRAWVRATGTNIYSACNRSLSYASRACAWTIFARNSARQTARNWNGW